MQFKTSLHNHFKEENVRYDLFELLDEAKRLNFDILAITPHNRLFQKKELSNYDEKLDILVIPGIEKEIEKSHIIILNPDKEIEKINSFTDLIDYKKNNPEIFIIAPHPFFYFYSLGRKLEKYIKIFDAIELSYFYNSYFNLPNKKALKIAQKYNLPFIATSDTHFLKNLNKNYILVNSPKKDIKTIFQQIKNFNFQNFSQPSSFKELFSDFLKLNFNFKD